MTKKKRNTKPLKRMRRKWKPLLCLALLTSLCASTISYGSSDFADTENAGTAAEMSAGIAAEMSAEMPAGIAAEMSAEMTEEVIGVVTDAEDLSFAEDQSEANAAAAGTNEGSGTVTDSESVDAARDAGAEPADNADAGPADDSGTGTGGDADAKTDEANAGPDEADAGPNEDASAASDEDAAAGEEKADADPSEEEESTGEGLTVTIRQGEGGTLSFVNASGDTAAYLPGDTVCLKAVYDTISPILSTNIYTAGGERIDATWTGEDEFFFIMPDEDVTISPAYYGITEDFLMFDRSVREVEEQLAFLPMKLSGSEQAYYVSGSYIAYEGYGTRHRYVDGNEAYCVEPSYAGPETGWYDKHYDVENYIVVDSKSYGYEYVKSALWVSYGSPGFDASYWPSVWCDGSAMTADRYYVLAHIVLADIYSANAYATLYGTNDNFREYVYTYVTGYNGDGSESYNFANSTRGKIASALEANGYKSFADDGFNIFVLHISGGYQDIISFEYVETPDTYLTVKKTSSDSDTTDGSADYSLMGAVYYAYTDEACTDVAQDVDGNEAKFVTTSTGASNVLLMDVGTYWVKEVTASEGFSLDTSAHKVDVTSDNTEDNPALVTSVEPVKYGYIELTKKSGNTDISGGNSLYSLSGAVFGIYSDEGCKNLVESMTTNSDGYAMSGSLPLGTYYVKETGRPKGYSLDDGTVYKVKVESASDAGSTVVEVNGSGGISDTPLYDTLGIEIVKFDEETGGGTPQGDADLTGAQFEICFYAGDVSENSVSGTSPARTWVIETRKSSDGTYQAILDDSHLVSGDALFYNNSGKVILPLGTYTIKEITAPAGYRIKGTFSDSDGKSVAAGETYYTQILDDGSTSGSAVRLRGDNEFTQSDTVIRGGVKVQKRDLESGRTQPQGAATFEGAVFTITNESEWPVLVDNTLYQSGEEVMRLVTDENGYAETGSDTLPYGTYRITEIQQPNGYLLGSIVLDAATEQVFEIRTDGEIVDLTGPEDSVTDQVKRADFSFEKQDGDNQSTDLGSVKFMITSATTGESHVFWTDPNGQYSSSSDWEPHTQNTNAGESFEDGLWFYGYADWDEADLDYVDDSLGALPYDTYILEELPCESNAGRTLITTRFTVYGDSTDLGERADVHLGTINNYSFGYVTSAASSENGEKYLAADESAQITDEISYWGLTRGEPYRFVAELYDVTADDMVRDEEGDAVSSETVFTPRLSEGTQAVTLSLDATDLEGHTLVVFEYLYDGDDDIIVAEADAEIEDQTVYFAGIGTTLVNDETGEHEATVYEDTEIVLTDTVSFKGLSVGTTYVIRGVLMDRETGEVLLDVSGDKVCAESEEFTAESSDGEVEISFSFCAYGTSCTHTVAFEYLYEAETGALIAKHADLKDEGQTVELITPPTPETPETPEVPETPETPEVPETPETPEVPETPETPEIPETPVTISTPTESPSPAVPKTGDAGNTLWIIVVAAAASCLILSFAMRRRIKRG